MKHSGLVCRDLNIAYQGWITPDAERIVGEAAGADNLLVVRAPSKAGNLRTGVDTVNSGASRSVPEVDVTVV